MIRPPAVADAFYPGNSKVLSGMVETYLEKAKNFDISSLKGLIVPHAGYIYSGPIAGYGYRQLQNLSKKKYKVFLIGPSHHAFISASVGSFEAYETPLGRVKVNQKICSELVTYDGLDFLPDAHLPEHCLEVQLPFLQEILSDFEIIPVLCGNINPDDLAHALAPYFGQKDNLFIISSDLSHYLPYEEAKKKDTRSLEVIKNLDLAHEDEIDACGQVGIKTIMRLASENNYSLQLLDCQNSGDTAGDKNGVVGYGALAIIND